jgi:endonuclease-3 related protein
MRLRPIYTRLLSFHGPQGWWPILNSRTGKSEYFVGAPRNSRDFVEIAAGAILTQNVSWANAERAVAALKKNKLLDTVSLHTMATGTLAGLIRSAGYYNQKALKIKHFVDWHRSRDFRYQRLLEKDTFELRGELLGLNGIGPETADSILLYGLGRRIFVIDAYTRRIFIRLGIFSGNETYAELQAAFHSGFRGTAEEYNEYHALIVAHGKDYCKKIPRCDTCRLSDLCLKKI